MTASLVFATCNIINVIPTIKKIQLGYRITAIFILLGKDENSDIVEKIKIIPIPESIDQ